MLGIKPTLAAYKAQPIVLSLQPHKYVLFIIYFEMVKHNDNISGTILKKNLTTRTITNRDFFLFSSMSHAVIVNSSFSLTILKYCRLFSINQVTKQRSTLQLSPKKIVILKIKTAKQQSQ